MPEEFKQEPEGEPKPKKKRGTAAMSPSVRKKVASAGGKSHTSEHMAAIGHLGGVVVSRNINHMREIGRIGGLASGYKKKPEEQK